jgi:UPF0755 protein
MKALLLRYKFVVLSAVVIAVAVAGWFLYVFFGGNWWEGTMERSLYVSRGQSFASIVDSLDARGIIRNKSLFVFVAKISGGVARLHVGKYVFRSGVSNNEIYQELRTGRGSSLISVTVPEGLQAKHQARLFSHALGIDSTRFVTVVHDALFARSLGIESGSLEGYLLPDTYWFMWQQDEKDIIRKMVEAFKQFYADSLRERARTYGWTTNQVLALASIVEGETRIASERTIVAGVYHNRLRKGMKLEADPTIQFILGDGPRRVLYSDLRIDDPYNTYLHVGLPPGAVNNPGRATILATLYPSQHMYLYFVANGSGGHWFSRTYEEHQRYVRMYRRIRARQHAELLQRPHEQASQVN